MKSMLTMKWQNGWLVAVGLLLAACGGAQPSAETEAPTEVPAATTAPAATAAPAQEAGAPVAAFVRDRALYLQTGDDPAAAQLIEDCAAADCHLQYLAWSPDGSRLVYYVDSFDPAFPRQVKVVNAQGVVQTVTERAAANQPAGWSPDGTQLVYRTDTERTVPNPNGPQGRVQELWTVAVAVDGQVGEPQLRGEVTYGEGCGGGGRSESALAYEREGGNAYGFRAGVMAWTPGDILLYTDACANRGVARFDLAAGAALEPYAGGLRSLTLNAAGDAFAAIDDQNRLVVGTPDSVATQVVALEINPEMVFYGQVSGQLYVTTLSYLGETDIFDLAAGLDQAIMLQPFADEVAPQLYRVDPATGAATLLYEGAGYAYAQVRETADGAVIFSQVEDNAELVAALQAGQVTPETWRTFLPTVDVMAWREGAVTLQVANTGQYTPAP